MAPLINNTFPELQRVTKKKLQKNKNIVALKPKSHKKELSLKASTIKFTESPLKSKSTNIIKNKIQENGNNHSKEATSIKDNPNRDANKYKVTKAKTTYNTMDKGKKTGSNNDRYTSLKKYVRTVEANIEKENSNNNNNKLSETNIQNNEKYFFHADDFGNSHGVSYDSKKELSVNDFDQPPQSTSTPTNSACTNFYYTSTSNTDMPNNFIHNKSAKSRCYLDTHSQPLQIQLHNTNSNTDNRFPGFEPFDNPHSQYYYGKNSNIKNIVPLQYKELIPRPPVIAAPNQLYLNAINPNTPCPVRIAHQEYNNANNSNNLKFNNYEDDEVISYYSSGGEATIDHSI
ncbi:uncharacterized protein SCDLUD_004898 [Saccharomycodes ludwigii]|uniref:uncharacterized protein n=1 Tax=Saccharomycodes ludwigii TaxID=36035 RepID=UPI001E84131E|nr:hypothetical protein SCDLUD_004898 [Saccharomycodes ludwigii]KAH3899455.1 hypothetical protein SCDLUD_004898 [Saccharomycodes ludwigii]